MTLIHLSVLLLVVSLLGAKGVKVSLYYEALCPDSIRFVKNQLYPNFDDLKDYISLELVPYGFASEKQVNGTWEFTCQHGPDECTSNKYQGCAFAQNLKASSNVNFANCVESLAKPGNVDDIKECAKKFGYDVEKLQKCATSEEGDNILIANGNKTYNVQPSITFIPTIVYDDVFNQTEQDQSLTDFPTVVCNKIEGDKPAICERKVKVTVYYEALCPDSIRFITKQLYPNYNKFQYYLDVELVPYGKATQKKVNGVWSFTCQHGAGECTGNKYQACGFSQNQTPETHIEFANCAMKAKDPSDPVDILKCAIKYNYNVIKLQNCAKSEEGSELLAKYGDKTHAVKPKIAFIPTIIYNDVFEDDVQDQSLEDFASVLCSKITFRKPEFCTNSATRPRTFWNMFSF